MTKLNEFLAGRGPAEMYEAYWTPCTLWPFAVSLSELVSPGDSVLDVGAGTGLLCDLAAARVGAAGRVTALEPTPFMQEVLRTKFGGGRRVAIVECGIEDAALPDAEFDVLLAHQVMQYVADPPAAFAQMRRLLKPGGTLGVGVWSGSASQAFSPLEDGFLKHFGPEFAPIHAWSFGGLERLGALAGNAGFKIEKLEKQIAPARFKSVEEFMNAHIAAGMRFDGDEVLMGIFDLADPSYEPKADRLLQDLKAALAEYEGPEGFVIPLASDVLIARA